MTSFQTIEMKLGLATRGKWTSKHGVSQEVYNYIYIFAKVKFQKFIPLSMLYTHTWILLFLECYFETIYVKNDSKLYFCESIYYIIYNCYWPYRNEGRIFSGDRLDNLQRLLFGTSVAFLRLVLLFPIGIIHRVFSSLCLCLTNV